MFDKVPPLNWAVQIVDRDGRPSPEFIRWFNQLFANTDELDQTKQEHDADLDALAALSGTGFVARTGDGAIAARTFIAGPGITITNPDGVAGAPEFSASGGGVLPLVDGSIPPVFIQNPDGSLVYGEIG